MEYLDFKADKSASSKMRQLKSSSQNGAFQCVKCGRLYKWQTSLYKHIRLECGKEPKYVCEMCGIKLKHKHHLQLHYVQKHLGTQLPV